MNFTELFSIALIALGGSFGHCLGMCGGLVLAYSSSKINGSVGTFGQLLRHIIYHSGRVFTYALLGIIAATVGHVSTLGAVPTLIVYLCAGGIMILTALAMLGVSNALLSIEYSLNRFAWFKNSFGKLIKSQSLSSFFGLGMLNGLFPCGFVYFFLAKAATETSIFGGALVMTVFGLATIPALTLLGSSATVLKNGDFRKYANKLSAFAIFIYGAYTIYKAIEIAL